MNNKLVKPGDVVATSFGIYQHWSLVSDRVCARGKPMLISATERHGTVKEEAWDVVTKGHKTYVVNIPFCKPVHEVISAARTQIDSWKYSLTERNCEHFVKWATGFEVSSTQVKAAVTGAVIGAVLVGVMADKPSMLKFLGGAVAVGGLALASTKAIEKTEALTEASAT